LIREQRQTLIISKMKPRFFGLLSSKSYAQIEKELMHDIWSEWNAIAYTGWHWAGRVKQIKSLCISSESDTISLNSEDIYVLRNYLIQETHA